MKISNMLFCAACLGLSALAVAGVGCKTKPHPPADGGAPATQPSPGMTGQRATTSFPADKLTMIEGSCAGGRELVDLADYRVRLRAKQNSLGFIRIRREAIWTLEDLSNVLGTVPCGTILWGRGPVKNADYSMGVGYAVAVRDAQGRQCRGYVSYTVVDVVAE